ncbi:hypothetical protein GCM10010510_15380 [Streptomyces anandii JCM 4720]|nr:hypothetical protein GCM10010510_15380 [Streptomyces anandii JCM 4720]
MFSVPWAALPTTPAPGTRRSTWAAPCRGAARTDDDFRSVMTLLAWGEIAFGAPRVPATALVIPVVLRERHGRRPRHRTPPRESWADSPCLALRWLDVMHGERWPESTTVYVSFSNVTGRGDSSPLRSH